MMVHVWMVIMELGVIKAQIQRWISSSYLINMTLSRNLLFQASAKHWHNTKLDQKHRGHSKMSPSPTTTLWKALWPVSPILMTLHHDCLPSPQLCISLESLFWATYSEMSNVTAFPACKMSYWKWEIIWLKYFPTFFLNINSFPA